MARCLFAAAKLLCSLLISSGVAAQATLEIQLAADPQGNGPPAISWVRDAYLPRTSGWPHARSPRDSVGLRITADGVELTTPELPQLGDSYAVGRIDLGGGSWFDLRCDFDGYEELRGRIVDAPRVRRMLRLLRLDLHSGPLELDVGSLIGASIAARDESNPTDQLLGVGAAECGNLTLAVERSGSSLRLRGRSAGGLTLPALLWWLADSRHTTPADTQEEAWRTLAICARDASREEAARQLAIHRGPGATDMLERMLLTDDFTRVVAMHALLNRGSLASLPAMLGATQPGDRASEELARAALDRWLPHTPVTQRASILGGLTRHASPQLQSFATDYPAMQRNAAAVSVRGVLFVLAIGSALALAAVLWFRRASSELTSPRS